ncbi:hypothetical protein C7N83_05815 [Neisseria iguanae]|uniref:Uncharacterized protein n=1 Tax=Neisseria iguanae TaxID=90242 RepID=A0A2P7U0J9_9NEIS|nr:hypothetical protein C7N83_05815 [Neisseria iguanae]
MRARYPTLLRLLLFCSKMCDADEMRTHPRHGKEGDVLCFYVTCRGEYLALIHLKMNARGRPDTPYPIFARKAKLYLELKRFLGFFE